MSLKLVKTEEQSNISSNESLILKGLNKPQAEAVTTINGPLLVVAGAGSGKTRVLTHRTAYLIENGVNPANILALTFTNKAANEMKERIASIVSREQAQRIWAGTFHSVFARLLRQEATQLGYTASFTIYDTEDSLKLVRHIMSRLGISHEEFSAQNVRSRISWAKNQMISWQKFSDSADSVFDKQVGMIYQEYEKELLANNSMDFDDLLNNMIRLLRLSDSILKTYQSRFKYILVDEYQDTNRAQYLVINLLAGSHKNICVVGDDAQSIYRWRGADIRNILDFQKDYPNAKIIRLEQNYRSTKTILSAAASVIRNNRNQIPKELWTENSDGDKIELLSCPDDRSEAARIAEVIKDCLNKDYKRSDIAVLYRTNAQSLAIENALRRENLPYIVVAGTSFYKRKEVKDALAYIRLLLNQKDGESLLRVINEPPRGLGQVSLNHFTTFAHDNSTSLFEAFVRAEEIDGLQTRAVNAANNFTGLVLKYSSQLGQSSPAELITNFIEETGLLGMYKEINTEDSLDRWNNIQQLLSDMSQYFRENSEAALEDYMQQITLVSDIDLADTSQNRISLMTLHSAKGLEFPIVFIAGLEKGLFPLTRGELHHEEEEEERRLFYVGITRAMEKLYLSYANSRMKFGDVSRQFPSEFLSEIDKTLIKGLANVPRPMEKSEKREYVKDESFSFRKPVENEYSQIPEATFSFRVGDRVIHKQFGKGQITGLSGSGDQRQAVVYFSKIGEKKRLMLKYAKLEPAG